MAWRHTGLRRKHIDKVLRELLVNELIRRATRSDGKLLQSDTLIAVVIIVILSKYSKILSGLGLLATPAGVGGFGELKYSLEPSSQLPSTVRSSFEKLSAISLCSCDLRWPLIASIVR